MPGNPKECRQHALNCVQLATKIPRGRRLLSAPYLAGLFQLLFVLAFGEYRLDAL